MAGTLRKILPIVEKEVFNNLYYVLWIEDKDMAQATKPGQFYQLTPVKKHARLLRKPISVFDVCQNQIGFMIKVVGDGTEELANLSVGESLDLIGPLGNSFEYQNKKNILMITGGIGYAPMKLLKRKAFQNQINTLWIHGGRSIVDIFDADLTFTNDGSHGKKGFVTIGLEEVLRKESFDAIYCCGPDIMMQACTDIAKKYDQDIFVSMETYMACGIGVCKGCVVAIEEQGDVHYKTACKDGPIFDGKKVVWDA